MVKANQGKQSKELNLSVFVIIIILRIEYDYYNCNYIIFLIALAPLSIFHRVMKLWKLLVIIFCFGLLAFLLMPNSPRCVKSGNRDRHCFSNIRILTGAIEMYVMDHGKPFRELTETSMEELIREQYLRSFTKDEECEYKSKGELDFDKKDSGFIYCTYHGDIDGYLESKRFQDDKKKNTSELFYRRIQCS